MNSKSFLILATIALAIIIAAGLWFSQRSLSRSTTQPAVPTKIQSGNSPFSTIVQTRITIPPRIEKKISEVVEKGKKVDVQGDTNVVVTDEYSIMFVPANNEFSIAILASPFDTIRQKAEDTFLKLLEISKEEACQLNVNISTPQFANPDYAGQIFPLSFCETPPGP